jgi:hypothetical protein
VCIYEGNLEPHIKQIPNELIFPEENNVNKINEANKKMNVKNKFFLRKITANIRSDLAFLEKISKPEVILSRTNFFLH